VVSFITGRVALGEEPAVPVGWETGWAPDPIWTFGEEKIAFCAGTRTSDRPSHSQVTIPTILKLYGSSWS
jgi:hypothetical protein